MNLSETAFLVARPDGDHDLRWFTPAAEVDLCGHATLAAHWSERTGRDELTGFQASARGGTVRTGCAGDRVVLGGRAVTVSEVRLLAEADRG